MKVKLWMCASFVGLLGASLGAATQVEATPSTASSAVLAQATVAAVDVTVHNRTVDGKRWRTRLETRGLTDGYVVDNKFQPGQSTGWHSHPGPSLIFVVSGSVTNYESGTPRCAGVTYQAGTSFVDAGGTDVHMLRNDGTVPAETIAVQFIPNGLPRRIDQPVPNCCSA
jgi:quercetin dioxygenase-like cupin family protein